MKHFNIAVISILLLIFSNCTVDTAKNVKSVPVLISEGFINDNEYEIVCIGFPKDGLKGAQKEESAKRAALLNVYFYSKNRFDDTVNPDQDGKIENFTMYEDHGRIKYLITKSNLKKRLKK